jgi:hypothetical protein
MLYHTFKHYYLSKNVLRAQSFQNIYPLNNKNDLNLTKEIIKIIYGIKVSAF